MKRKSFLGIALILLIAAALIVLVGQEKAQSQAPECTFWGVAYDNNTQEPLPGITVSLTIGAWMGVTTTDSQEGHEGEYSIGPSQGTGLFCLSSEADGGDIRDAYWGNKTDPDPEEHDLYLDELGPECPSTR